MTNEKKILAVRHFRKLREIMGINHCQSCLYDRILLRIESIFTEENNKIILGHIFGIIQ